MAAALEAVAMSVAQMDVPAFLYTHIFLNAQILNSHEQAFQIASNAASRIPLSQQYFKQATFGVATQQYQQTASKSLNKPRSKRPLHEWLEITKDWRK